MYPHWTWGNNPDTELVTPYIVIKSFGVNAKYLLFIIYFSKLIIDLFFYVNKVLNLAILRGDAIDVKYLINTKIGSMCI